MSLDFLSGCVVTLRPLVGIVAHCFGGGNKEDTHEIADSAASQANKGGRSVRWSLPIELQSLTSAEEGSGAGLRTGTSLRKRRGIKQSRGLRPSFTGCREGRIVASKLPFEGLTRNILVKKRLKVCWREHRGIRKQATRRRRFQVGEFAAPQQQYYGRDGYEGCFAHSAVYVRRSVLVSKGTPGPTQLITRAETSPMVNGRVATIKGRYLNLEGADLGGRAL